MVVSGLRSPSSLKPRLRFTRAHGERRCSVVPRARAPSWTRLVRGMRSRSYAFSASSISEPFRAAPIFAAYPSLPRLLLIANCCGCCVSDILLGNKVILRKVDPASVARPLIVRQRWGAATKTSERLLAELGRIFESGSAQNLRQAARLLDVDEKFLRKLAPDIARRLVKRGRETMRREKIQREEARFDAFRQSFQELRLESIYPTAQKVIARMYQRTGRGVGYLERTRFHRRALHLEETALRPGAELDDRDSASKSVQVWKDVPCKTTNSCRLRR